MGYAWDILSRHEFERLLELSAVRKEKPAPISNHWLTSGEIWAMIGFGRYGTPQREVKYEDVK